MDNKTKDWMIELESRLRKVEMENTWLWATVWWEGKTGWVQKEMWSNAWLNYMQERCRDLERQVVEMQDKINVQESASGIDGKWWKEMKKWMEKHEDEMWDMKKKLKKWES